jgi:hypothetical protein
MADSSVRKGAKVTEMASESPNASPHGGSPSPSRPVTPSTSKQGIQKLGSWLRKPFSKGKSRGAEPTPIGIGMAQEQDSPATSTTDPDTLLVRMESTHIKEDTVGPAKMVAGYNLAIAAIEIFQPIVECTDFVLPTPVGKMLEQLTKVLGVLKVRSFHEDSGSTEIMPRSKWWRIERRGRSCMIHWFITQINSMIN